jgi:hypothetical protein
VQGYLVARPVSAAEVPVIAATIHARMSALFDASEGGRPGLQDGAATRRLRRRH